MATAGNQLLGEYGLAAVGWSDDGDVLVLFVLRWPTFDELFPWLFDRCHSQLPFQRYEMEFI